MQEVNHHPPEMMTSEQRRNEAAMLLAKGIVRLRALPVEQSANVVRKSEFGLAFSGEQSVHTDPVNNRKPESR